MSFDILGSDSVRLLAGMFYAILALLSPKAGLFILLPTIALAPEMQVGRVVFRPDDLMMTILVVAWASRRLADAVRRPTPLDQPLWAYFAIGLAATLWGVAQGTADLWAVSKTSASGLHLVKRLEFVLLFFILKDTLRSVRDVRQVIYLFMASLVAMSTYAFGRYAETGYIALGPSGTPVHEPGLASMLNVGLSLGLLVGSRGMATSVLATGVLLGSIWVLPYSLGRNYLAATLLMLGLVVLSRKRALLFLFPVVAAVAVLALPGLPLPQHIIERFSTLGAVFSPQASAQGVSIVERIMPALTHIWEVLLSSPLLGWGLGSIALGSIDNEYAGQFVYTGILGFAVFLWLAVRIARTAREAYEAARQQGSPALPLIAGLQHCLLGYALYSVFSPSISAARAGAFFFTITGLVAVLHRELVAAPAPEREARAEVANASFPPLRKQAGGMEWTT